MTGWPELHPIIVHTPIAMIIVSFVFELVGRATDGDWWRKAALAMLVVGVLGAGAAVLSGDAAGELAEHQGVPEGALDQHEDMSKIALWLGLGAVAVRALASRAGAARTAAGGLGLALHLAAAIAVGIAGFRGGKLVYEHGAGVRIAPASASTNGRGEAAGEAHEGGAAEAGKAHNADHD
jgi:uncharacterized membrane protein